MNNKYSLSLTEYQHKLLQSSLYPGDGSEAVAILLCARHIGAKRQRLVVREVWPVMSHWYQDCSADGVTWSTDALEPILDIAELDDLSLVKIHSHPGGYPMFSATDDYADQRLLPAVRDWMDEDRPHGSAVMLPDGQLFGRVLYGENTSFQPFDLIMVVGDDIRIWFANAPGANDGDFCASHAQAFGCGTNDILRNLTVAVVGCSGTGSPVVEQLARLGIKRLILVDDDVVEDRNLNRILHSTRAHAVNGIAKVNVLAEGIRSIGLKTEVIAVHANLAEPETVDIVAEADIVFGCMDSIEGRYILNRLATYYTQPYFDIGVRLVADGASGIEEICGTIHYLQPGRSSLVSRGLFSLLDVTADGLRRQDPYAYRQQLQDGYIRGASEQRPAVISVNMYAASLAINELLARLHNYRDEPNSDFASVGFSLSSMELYSDPEDEPCALLRKHVGSGDVEPRLGLLQFARSKKR